MAVIWLDRVKEVGDLLKGVCADTKLRVARHRNRGIRICVVHCLGECVRSPARHISIDKASSRLAHPVQDRVELRVLGEEANGSELLLRVAVGDSDPALDRVSKARKEPVGVGLVVGDGQVLISQHLLVPRLRREACVEQEACWRDQHSLVADLVGSVHEQVVDRGVTCASPLCLFLVGRVTDNHVEPLRHVTTLPASRRQSWSGLPVSCGRGCQRGSARRPRSIPCVLRRRQRRLRR